MSAARGDDDWLLETAVHGLDERPGAHIRHVHAFGGFANRAGFRHEPEQIRLARPKGDFLSAHDPKTRLQ